MKPKFCKTLCILLLILLCVINISGCSDRNAIAGLYSLTAAAVDGESIAPSEYGTIELQLAPDGTAILTTDSQTEQSTWSYDNSTLVIDGMDCTYDNGSITISADGMYMKFTKQQ